MTLFYIKSENALKYIKKKTDFTDIEHLLRCKAKYKHHRTPDFRYFDRDTRGISYLQTLENAVASKTAIRKPNPHYVSQNSFFRVMCLPGEQYVAYYMLCVLSLLAAALICKHRRMLCLRNNDVCLSASFCFISWLTALLFFSQGPCGLLLHSLSPPR